MRGLRVQFKRVRGWKKPLNTVYVGRSRHTPLNKWGNPHAVGGDSCRTCPLGPHSAAQAVSLYRLDLRLGRLPFTKEDARRELRGVNLGCWCRADQPCHADVLLEVANE